MGEARRRGTRDERVAQAISAGRIKEDKPKKTTTDGMTHRTIPLPSVNTPGKSSLKWGAGFETYMRRATPTSPLQGTVDATGSRSDDLSKTLVSARDTQPASYSSDCTQMSEPESALGVEC